MFLRPGLFFSLAAETALGSGGPAPNRGLVLGRGRARFRFVRLGAHKVRKVRGSAADAHDAADVFLYRDSSVAPLLDTRRRFRAVMDVLDSMISHGVTLARSVELTAQWSNILSTRPLYLVHWMIFMKLRVLVLVIFVVSLGMFIPGSVISFMVLLFTGIRRRRNWLRDDPHQYKWLGPDLVTTAPFVQCKPHLTPGGSGVLADPARIDEEFREAWLPYFCRSGQRETSLEQFNEEVDGWLPILPEVALPWLTGQMLADVVQRKGATAGSLDGWVWRDLNVLPVAWFDELARVLAKVEDVGVWPDGYWMLTLP